MATQKEKQDKFDELLRNHITYQVGLGLFNGIDALQINHLVFAMPTDLPPPTAIKIEKEIVNNKWQTLRSSIVQKTSAGYTTATISFSLIFSGLQNINAGLRELLGIFEALPFVYVENAFIRASLMPGSTMNMACSLLGIAVQTLPEYPDTVQVQLMLMWFNYQPFAKNFIFRSDWTTSFEKPSGVAFVLGNDTKPQKPIWSIDDPAYDKRDPYISYQTPALVPQQSKPLMELVAQNFGPLYSGTGWANETISIGYREYEILSAQDPDYAKKLIAELDSQYLHKLDPTYVVSNHPSADLRLEPVAKIDFDRFAKAFYTKFKKKLRVNSCYRSQAKQDELQADPDLKEVVASGTSWHECGMAIDLNIVNYLTFGEWEWLVENASIYGWSNLGAKYHAIPYTGAGIDRPATKDAMCLPLQYDLHIRGTFTPLNWETWHFDYTRGQTAACRGRSSNVARQVIIDNILAEDRMREEIRASQTQGHGNETVERLRLLGYKLDQLASTSLSLYFFQEREIELTGYHVQVISASKRNFMASIPIQGYEYATQQYLGRTDWDLEVVMFAESEGQLAVLQGVIESTQSQYRAIRGARKNLSYKIKNSFINFLGIQRVLIDKIDIQNIDGAPGFYKVALSLTQFEAPKSNLAQEKLPPDTFWTRAAQYVFNNFMQLDYPSYIQLAKYIRTREIDDLKLVGATILGGPAEVESLYRTINRNASPKILVKRSYLQYLEETSNTIDPDFLGIIVGTKENPGYAEVLAEIITHPISDAGLRELYVPDSIIRLVREYNASVENQRLTGASQDPWFIQRDLLPARIVKDEAQRITDYKKILQTLWNRIYAQSYYYDQLFDKFRLQYDQELQRSLTGLPCYPDLKLPPHPLTNEAIDTAPDYWFFNESIDGAQFLPSKEKDMIQDTKLALVNSYDSCTKVSSFEAYQKAYNSPHKGEIAAKASANQRGLLASASRDESGLQMNKGMKLDLQKIKALQGKDTNNRFNTHIDDYKNAAGIEDDAETGPNRITNDTAKDLDSIDGSSSENLEKLLDATIKDTDLTLYGLAKAYPTFKIYFLEDDETASQDTGRQGMRNFDDFYSYSAVKDIRIVHDRKIPSAVCVISLTNIYGDLENLVYSSTGDLSNSSARVVEKFDPATVNTKAENPFQRLVLMEGSKIQIRLGYSNNPNELTTVFNGQVAEIEVSSISQDIITIVCQDFATELVMDPIAEVVGAYDSTQELLSTIICRPEIKHFGRWSTNAQYNPLEARTSVSSESAWDMGLLGTRLAAKSLGSSINRNWIFVNKPQDDNVFAPSRGSYMDNPFWSRVFDFLPLDIILNDIIGIWDDDMEYYPLGVTAWDIFKEMELRHPNFIACPIPYGNRMTMFFGPPNHRYWSRPLNQKEETFFETIGKTLEDLSGILDSCESGHYWRDQNIDDIFKKEGLEGVRRMIDVDLNITTANELRLRFGDKLKTLLRGHSERYIPFRKYHLLHSGFNIVNNSMSASAHGTFNTVRLAYMDDQTSANERSNIKKAVEKGDSAAIEAARERCLLSELGIMEMKADDNISDAHTRVMNASFPSCTGSFFAKRYAVGLLMRSLRDTYKGEITILGDPTIKLYDICMLFDTYREIYGPVEVGRVVHMFSSETGYITEIKPDLVITHNAYTVQSTLDAMCDLTKMGWERFGGTGMTLGLTGATITTGLAGYALGGSASTGLAGMAGTKVGALAVSATTKTAATIGKVSHFSVEMLKSSKMIASTLSNAQRLMRPAQLGLRALASVAGGGPALMTTIALAVGVGYLACRFVEWTQGMQPIIITPVMNGCKPMIAGLEGFKRDNLFLNFMGKYERWTNNLAEGWSDFVERNTIRKEYWGFIADIVD